jgi:hypothetical protein
MSERNNITTANLLVACAPSDGRRKNKKGKIHAINCHEGKEGKQSYSCTL